MKAKKYIVVSLELLIILVFTLLCSSLFIKKSAAKKIEPPVTLEEKSPDNINNEDSITYIQLGIYPLVSGEGVNVDDSKSEIQIIKGGTYILSGSLFDISIHINTPESVVLNFNGVQISSSKEAIVIDEALDVNINITGDNYITDGALNSYASAIYANCPLKINGSGKLVIYASKKAIETTYEYDFKDIEFIAFEKEQSKVLKEASQSILYFHLPESISNKKIILSDNENIVFSENAKEDMQNIIISSPQIKKTKYMLYQKDLTDESENIGTNILINDNNVFEVLNTISTFG